MRVYVQDKRLNIQAENIAEGFQLGLVAKQLEYLEFFPEIIHDELNGVVLAFSRDHVTTSCQICEPATNPEPTTSLSPATGSEPVLGRSECGVCGKSVFGLPASYRGECMVCGKPVISAMPLWEKNSKSHSNARPLHDECFMNIKED